MTKRKYTKRSVFWNKDKQKPATVGDKRSSSGSSVVKSHYRAKTYKPRVQKSTAYHNDVLKVLLSQKRINRELVLKTIQRMVG